MNLDQMNWVWDLDEVNLTNIGILAGSTTRSFHTLN
jgi:hypothetical protein